ncbi:MAG: hypothetical protein K6U80_15330 [Firmicutes bacterium]|nr:hypothetical protein [Bacillota bacterium]
MISIILAITLFLSKAYTGLIIILIYTLTITLISGIDLHFFLRSLASYAIIILGPYLFGFLLSLFFSFFASGVPLPPENSFINVIIKMARIFFLWHIGSLFLDSTPIQSVVCFLNKILKPLNRLGVPVSRLMSVIMGIALELPETVNTFTKIFSRKLPLIVNRSNLSLKARITIISDTIADLIIKSLQKTEKTQEVIEKIHANQLNTYSFQIHKKEIIAIISCLALIIVVFFSEKPGLL